MRKFKRIKDITDIKDISKRYITDFWEKILTNSTIPYIYNYRYTNTSKMKINSFKDLGFHCCPIPTAPTCINVSPPSPSPSPSPSPPHIVVVANQDIIQVKADAFDIINIIVQHLHSNK